jgi:NAD(P)-dependent dehydrogenase (short-subunit alcohol dehydrogenase family)
MSDGSAATNISPATDQAPGVAWIVGVGASTGLGAAVARRFAKSGLTVALTGRDPERIHTIAREITSGGGQAHALPGDGNAAKDSHRVASRVDALGPLRAAIFNAGNSVRGNSLDPTPAIFESTWRGSTYAGFLFAKAAIPRLIAGGGGTLLFTGATAALRGRGPIGAFASAKAGLRSLAQGLAREFGPRRIHVAHVAIAGGIDGTHVRTATPKFEQAGADVLLNADAIAETYWRLHEQHRVAWTHEVDLRPYEEAL